MTKARVYMSAKREFTCRILESGELVEAKALGNLLKKGDSVVVGDFVDISKIDETGEYMISSVDERKNEIFRIIIREAKRKVTASNVDLLIILSSVSKPQYKRGIIDRFLVRACQWGILPVVVFNKMDEYNEDEFDIQFEASRLASLGAKCFEICAKDKNYKPRYLSQGFSDLQELVTGKTSIFLGQSGVGKSKTISALAGGVVELKTNVVGRAGKGSHTTTWSEIVNCHNFEIIDSPGIRSFSLDDIDPDDLLALFPDLEEVAVSCQFNNCTHEENVKGCRFWSQDFSPETERGAMIHSRLESFKRIHEEICQTPFWQKQNKYS